MKSFCEEVEVVPSPSKTLSFSMILRLLRSIISADPYTIWRHYSSAYLKRMHELLKSNKFDLIHCDIMPLAYTIRNIRAIPCTLTDHDVCYVKALRISRQSRNIPLKLFLYFESLKLRNLERKIFERVNIGITVSEQDKSLLKKLCPKGNFIVIENGVDTSEFKPSNSGPEPNNLLWIGGFGYAPNREAMYYFHEKIYPLIKKEIPAVKLSIVGGGITKRLKNIICHILHYIIVTVAYYLYLRPCLFTQRNPVSPRP